MIIETSFEQTKNSRGESGSIRHFIIDSDSEASSLPTDAPIGSDALSKTSVFIKFSDGWSRL